MEGRNERHRRQLERNVPSSRCVEAGAGNKGEVQGQGFHAEVGYQAAGL